jgi:hypothetical protein
MNNEEKATAKKEWVSPELIELDMRETMAIKYLPCSCENTSQPSGSTPS